MGAIREILEACDRADDAFPRADWQTLLRLQHGVAIDLRHGAGLVRPVAGEPAALVVEDGGVTFCDLATGAKREVPTAVARLVSAAPHPWMPLMAVVDGASGGLCVQGYDGEVIYAEAAPRPGRNGRSGVGPGFTDCIFDDQAAFLWCVASVSRHEVEVQIRETLGWSVIASFLLEDRHGGSHPLFYRTSTPDLLALWLPGANGSSSTYWLTMESEAIRCAPEPGLDGALPPSFSPYGNEFVAVDGRGSVRRFAYPDACPTGICPRLPDDQAALDYCPPCYLDERLVLVMSRQNRMFLLDAFAMHVVREVVIEGHEPWPAEWRHAHRAGDRTLCTDITSFDKVGDMIVFNYVQNYRPGFPGGQSRLLCFPASAI